MDKSPPLPETFAIPGTLIADWLARDPTAPLNATLTKSDIDGLFFAIDHSINAVHALQDSLIAYSNGDLEGANARSWECSRRLIESQNKMRQVLTSIIASS